MDQNFATIQRSVAEDAALNGRVRLISITLDPDHDTPAVLVAHAEKRRADPAVWTFLTGDRVTIDRLAGRFGVGVLRNPATPTDITHNLRTVLAGADGRVVRIYTGNEWTTGSGARRSPVGRPRAVTAGAAPPPSAFTAAERRLVRRLRTPRDVQRYLNSPALQHRAAAGPGDAAIVPRRRAITTPPTASKRRSRRASSSNSTGIGRTS